MMNTQRRMMIFLVVLLGVPFVLSAQVNSYLRQAITHYTEGNYDEALFQLKKAQQTTRDEELTQTFFYLGAVYFWKGDSLNARENFKQAFLRMPQLDATYLPFSREVQQFYTRLRNQFPIITELQFTRFNPFQYNKQFATIQPQLIHAQQLKTVQLIIVPQTNTPVDPQTLRGMEGITHWDGFIDEDVPLPSGIYRFTFQLTNTEDDVLEQHFLVDVQSGSPYGNRLHTDFPQFHPRDSSGDWFGGVFLLSWLGWGIWGISEGINVLQSCLLGGILAMGTSYLLSPLAAIGSTVDDSQYNEQRRQEVEAQRRRLQAENEQIRSTYTIEMKVVESNSEQE